MRRYISWIPIGVFLWVLMCSFDLTHGVVVKGFYHPESAFVYKGYIYVSNIGSFNNSKIDGYISRLDLDGKVLEYRYESGLISPKGLWGYGNKLYVADVTRVCTVSLDSGKLKCISVPGSRFLNDIVVVDGAVYVTDTFTDNVYRIKGGRVSIFFHRQGLSPNGIVFLPKLEAFVVVSFSVPVINVISMDGVLEKSVYVKGFTGFDGVTVCGGSIYVSDYRTGTVLKTTEDFRRFSVVGRFKGNVSDIYCSQGIFLVPILSRNRVYIFKIH